ncbi:MAG: integrase [Candidatus Pacebacteria bacterium]|nr:integrase [Candidatus Paceibacterota bacterium]
MTNENVKSDVEIIEDIEFSYDGFQVVRGEFFAHTYEPSFTFNNNRVSVNTACIKKLPKCDYIQILVNPENKKLAVRPCQEDEKDSFRWCSATSKRSPKQITCRVFYAKVMSLMNWSNNNRYKLLGKLIRSGDDMLFVFNLDDAEVYKRNVKDDGTSTPSRIPSYPEDWKTQFGLPVDEHKSKIQINTFKGYAVFGLEKDNLPEASSGSITNSNGESEVNENAGYYEQLALNTAESTNTSTGSTVQSNSDTPQYTTSAE